MHASALLERPAASGSDDSPSDSSAAPPRRAGSSLRLAWSGPPAPLRVLVVDDEYPIRVLCRANLELEGFEVTLAASGPEAFEALDREPPDLILLDIMLPGLDGWEIAERVLSEETTRNVPIVFLSARSARADRERGFDAGAVGYVMKPFDPIGLGDTLQRVFDRFARGEREQLRREMLEEP